jgi:hypothetical protein
MARCLKAPCKYSRRPEDTSCFSRRRRYRNKPPDPTPLDLCAALRSRRWRKNPIPSGLWQREGPTFEPVCKESLECITCHSQMDAGKSCGYGVCKCSGFSNGGSLLPNLEVVDSLMIPAGLAPGAYVLQWRWDCEESDQVTTPPHACSPLPFVPPSQHSPDCVRPSHPTCRSGQAAAM